ncbi:PREDICTED: transcriptional protein SWT1, partial [Merops nubicus]|uniref:transcriptional protein SWT1 n=1 Tax=Merops nubicus TaxID=57421 RepID=UPI0004F0180D
MPKKKLKKLTEEEDCSDDQDDEKPEDRRSCHRTMREDGELQSSKIKKDGEAKKQDQSSQIPHGADGRSQGKSPNGSQEKSPSKSTTTDNSLTQKKEQTQILIQIKSKGIKQGKIMYAPDVVTTRGARKNKSRFDGKEGKKLWHSFELQRDKARKKKAEKTELCKLKQKPEKNMLEKCKLSAYNSRVPRKKADGSRKRSEDVRIPVNPSDTLPGTGRGDRSSAKKSYTLRRPWEEEYEEEYEKFSKEKHSVDEHTPSHRSTGRARCWGSCKRKRTDTDSDKAAGRSGADERDLEAPALCLTQNFEVPCTSDSYQEGEDIKSVQKSFVVSSPPQDSQNPETDQEMQIVEDLHVARAGKRMVLSVVQTCGKLTSMEIDLPEPDLNISAETFASGLNILVVIDTNIMISHLEFVRSLKSEEIPGVSRLALIIPWVVLQELDNLKKGKMLQHVRDKAIPAVQFIYTCLKNQDSKLWGQSMQLASQKMYGLSDENNDDRVLQCCLQYQNLFPQAVVILCTDDKNLCNKAIVSEVKAFCKADLSTALQNLSRHHSCVGLQQSKGRQLEKTEGGGAGLVAQFSNMLPDLIKNLGEALSCILETEMKIVYGNLWMEIVCLKPPWTLTNLLKCYKKHWMAVFGYVVPRSLLSTIEYLYKHLST